MLGRIDLKGVRDPEQADKELAEAESPADQGHGQCRTPGRHAFQQQQKRGISQELRNEDVERREGKSRDCACAERRAAASPPRKGAQTISHSQACAQPPPPGHRVAH